MDAWPRADSAHAFVNIPGSDAKFHAARRSNVGRNMSRITNRVINRGIRRGILRFIGRNKGLDVSGNGYEDSTVPG